jgi:hypothetical protein
MMTINEHAKCANILKLSGDFGRCAIDVRKQLQEAIIWE